MGDLNWVTMEKTEDRERKKEVLTQEMTQWCALGIVFMLIFQFSTHTGSHTSLMSSINLYQTPGTREEKWYESRSGNGCTFYKVTNNPTLKHQPPPSLQKLPVSQQRPQVSTKPSFREFVCCCCRLINKRVFSGEGKEWEKKKEEKAEYCWPMQIKISIMRAHFSECPLTRACK